MNRYVLLFFFLFQHNALSAVSMVYNFRIAKITKQPIHDHKIHHHNIIALLFDQYRKKYDRIFQNYVGMLGSYIYKWNHMSFRTDFAFSHILEKNSSGMVDFRGTETDDILFTLGGNADNK